MKAVLIVAGLAVCGLAVALAVMPWTLRGAARRAELSSRMGHAIGLDVRAEGRISLKLLPRPRVQILDIAIDAPDGSVSITAPALSGELDIPAMLRGHWRLVSATLLNPTASIDVDALGNGAIRSGGSTSNTAPFRLAVRSGVLRLTSRHVGLDTLLTDVSASLAKAPGAEGGFSAAGSLVWRGVSSQFTMGIGSPIRESAERQSSAFLQIGSAIGSFAAVGDISGGAQPQFAGRLSASTTAPDRLLPVLGLGPFWMNVQKIALNGDALAKLGDLSLSSAALRLNQTMFEGTLGYHTDNGHGLVEGTLATSRLDLGDLAGHDIDRSTLMRLYRTDLAPHLADTGVDLRISAGEVVIGDATAEEAAMSLLSRDHRLELTLDEAQAFGGVVKARLLASIKPDTIDARAEMTLSAVELGPLGVALTGHERMTGSLTGKVSLEGQGQTLGDIVPTLSGDGQVAVENGNFMGVSVSQALRRFTRRLPFGADQPGQLTSFAAASSTMKIEKGSVSFIDGKVSGPGIAMAFGGHGDLPRGNVDILAVASPTDAAGAVIAGSPGLPIEMRGTWGEPLMLLEHGSHLTVPKALIPEIDPAQILR